MLSATSSIHASGFNSRRDGDVCQSCQRWGKRPKKPPRRKLLADNGLRHDGRCVPRQAKPRGGTDVAHASRNECRWSSKLSRLLHHLPAKAGTPARQFDIDAERHSTTIPPPKVLFRHPRLTRCPRRRRSALSRPASGCPGSGLNDRCSPMSENEPHESQHGAAALEAARRVKLHRIQELGVDPWGQRFDDHPQSPPFAPGESEIVAEPPTEPGKPPQLPRPDRPCGRADRASARARQAGVPRTARLDRPDSSGHRHEPGRREKLGAGPAVRPGRPDRHRRRARAHEGRRADHLRHATCISLRSASKRRRKSTRAWPTPSFGSGCATST